LVGHPGPAVVRVDPPAVVVGPPARARAWSPALAVVLDVHPVAVGIERAEETDLHPDVRLGPRRAEPESEQRRDAEGRNEMKKIPHDLAPGHREPPASLREARSEAERVTTDPTHRNVQQAPCHSACPRVVRPRATSEDPSDGSRNAESSARCAEP